MTANNFKANNERKHGEMLASGDPEAIWGWGTPAGKWRASQRADRIALGARLELKMRVLEIGCGSGMFTEMFARSGAHIVAVDISPDLLALARGRNLPADRVQFLEKRFEDCDVDGPFDAIIGSSVLHHLDIDIALANIFGLLKPGGFISFAEPNMLNPQVFLERRFRQWFPYVSPDETAFVRWSLKRRLLAHGFENIVIEPLDWLHPATPVPMLGLVLGIGWWFEHLPLIRECSGSLYIRASRPGVAE